jgi:hypothetical protein
MIFLKKFFLKNDSLKCAIGVHLSKINVYLLSAYNPAKFPETFSCIDL